MEIQGSVIIFIIFPLIICGIYICWKTNLLGLLKAKKEESKMLKLREKLGGRNEKSPRN